MEMQGHGMRNVLRILAKKGVYEVFLYMKEHEDQGYNAIVSHMVSEKLVKSKTSANTAITKLASIGLLERRITNARPPRVCYKVNKKGVVVLRCLKEIEMITGSTR